MEKMEDLINGVWLISPPALVEHRVPRRHVFERDAFEEWTLGQQHRDDIFHVLHRYRFDIFARSVGVRHIRTSNDAYAHGLEAAGSPEASAAWATRRLSAFAGSVL